MQPDESTEVPNGSTSAEEEKDKELFFELLAEQRY